LIPFGGAGRAWHFKNICGDWDLPEMTISLRGGGVGGVLGHIPEVGQVAYPHTNKSRREPKASTTWFAFTNIPGFMGASFHSYLQIAMASPLCCDNNNVDDEDYVPPDNNNKDDKLI
jgi:hypothetical protein